MRDVCGVIVESSLCSGDHLAVEVDTALPTSPLPQLECICLLGIFYIVAYHRKMAVIPHYDWTEHDMEAETVDKHVRFFFTILGIFASTRTPMALTCFSTHETDKQICVPIRSMTLGKLELFDRCIGGGRMQVHLQISAWVVICVVSVIENGESVWKKSPGDEKCFGLRVLVPSARPRQARVRRALVAPHSSLSPLRPTNLLAATNSVENDSAVLLSEVLVSQRLLVSLWQPWDGPFLSSPLSSLQSSSRLANALSRDTRMIL